MKMKVACGGTGRVGHRAGCLGRAWKTALCENRGKHSDTPQGPDDTRTLRLEQPPETLKQPNTTGATTRSEPSSHSCNYYSPCLPVERNELPVPERPPEGDVRKSCFTLRGGTRPSACFKAPGFERGSGSCRRGPCPPALQCTAWPDAPPPGRSPGGSGRVSLSDVHSNGRAPRPAPLIRCPWRLLTGPRAGGTLLQAGRRAEQCLRPSGMHINAHEQHCHWGFLLTSRASLGSRSGDAAAGGSLNITAHCWAWAGHRGK